MNYLPYCKIKSGIHKWPPILCSTGRSVKMNCLNLTKQNWQMCKLKQLLTQHQALEASKKVFSSTCKLAYTTHSFYPTNAKLDSYAKTYLCNKWLVDEAKYRSSRLKTLKHSNSVRCHQKHSDKKSCLIPDQLVKRN